METTILLLADNLSKTGWSWGCGRNCDARGRTIWIADAHRGDGKCFVVRPDERLTAFMHLESETRDAPELRFEYCALRFLLLWEQQERDLQKQIAGDPSLEQIRSALRYFQVARTFKGLATDKAAQSVADSLQQVDRNPELSPEEKVVELAERFRKRFKRFNLAAASKLFWLKHKLPYIIYDSRARKALRVLRCTFGDADYSAYCTNWRNEYHKREDAIKQAASRLHEVRAFLQQHRTEAEIKALASEPWFLERVFDIYLWEMGRED